MGRTNFVDRLVTGALPICVAGGHRRCKTKGRSPGGIRVHDTRTLKDLFLLRVACKSKSIRARACQRGRNAKRHGENELANTCEAQYSSSPVNALVMFRILYRQVHQRACGDEGRKRTNHGCLVPTRFWQRPVGRCLVGGNNRGGHCFEGGAILQATVRSRKISPIHEDRYPKRFLR